jgi:hypothetical protein
MASIDSVSITILFGAVLVLAGIMSSLVALRFGAPLLLVFLLVGMLAGESGIGGIKFDDVRLAYTVGSVALGLILFDGGLRTRLATFRNVLAPAGLLATVGVLITATLTAPVAAGCSALTWSEALLVGAVMASTDAAAVFFLLHAKGCGSARASAPRSRSSPASTIRSRSSSPSSWSRSCSPASKAWTESLRCCWRKASSAASSAGSAAAPWCWCSTVWSCRRACTRRSSPPARW